MAKTQPCWQVQQQALHMAGQFLDHLGDSHLGPPPGSTLLTQGVGELIILKRHRVCAPCAILRICSNFFRSNFAGEKNPKCHSINIR